MSRVAVPPYERVMAKVEQQGECLVFTGRLSRSGYGRTSEQVNGRTKDLWAHRVVYEHHNGVIPPGKMVLHSCDNRPCVEITHLRVGTAKDNAGDMADRGRGRASVDKTFCARGHDLTLPGAVAERRTRSRNPAKAGGQRCLECQRLYGRESRSRQGYDYTGQPTNRDKTHCKRGHEFTAENTRTLANGARACRECARAAGQARRVEELRARAVGEDPVAVGLHVLKMRQALAAACDDDDVNERDGEPDELLQVGQVAARFAVTRGTVRRWTDAGLIPSERTPGGHRRYRAADVDDALRAHLAEADNVARADLLDRLDRREPGAPAVPPTVA